MVVGFCKLCFAKKTKIVDFKASFVNKIKKSNFISDIMGVEKLENVAVCSPSFCGNAECSEIIA